MQKQTPTWVVGNPLTAAKLNVMNADLETLFDEISSENISASYDAQGRCTQIVDNENSITVNIDWSDFDVSSPAIPKLYLQKAGDPKKWTISYSSTTGMVTSIVYA